MNKETFENMFLMISESSTFQDLPEHLYERWSAMCKVIKNDKLWTWKEKTVQLFHFASSILKDHK